TMGLGLDTVRVDERCRRRPGMGGSRQRARLRCTAADTSGFRRLPQEGRRCRWVAPGRGARRGRPRDPRGAGSADPAVGGAVRARRLRSGMGRQGRRGGGGGAMSRMARMAAVGIAAAVVSAASPAGASGAAAVAYIVMDADGGTVMAEKD